MGLCPQIPLFRVFWTFKIKLTTNSRVPIPQIMGPNIFEILTTHKKRVFDKNNFNIKQLKDKGPEAPWISGFKNNSIPCIKLSKYNVC